jgi:RimJ/RimL family protein N-acetyltransferase
MPVLVPPVVSPGTLSSTSQPVLDLGDLLVRPWAVEDARDLAQAYSDKLIRHWHVRSMTIEEAAAWVVARHRRRALESGADWAVTREGSVLGRVGLRTLDLGEGLAEVAYWVTPAARGRGVAGRAVDALAIWALDVVGLHRLDLRHSVRNVASCRVAVRCGFVVEGTARSSAQHADGWHDMHLHARLATGDPVSRDGMPPHLEWIG